MKAFPPLTAARLKELLAYDPETGIFTKRSVRCGPGRVGDEVGVVRPDGYIGIGVDGRRYLAHRLAWLYVNGEWPAQLIDHKDCLRSNNRITNLREATQSQNLANRGAPKSNKSGEKGICWDAQRQRWSVRVCFQRKNLYVGRFVELADAVAARDAEAARRFGEFARPA